MSDGAWAAGGNIIGSVLGFMGQQDTNSQNRQMFDSAQQFNQVSAKEQMQFQADMWQKNIDHQDAMSNTAYQRTMQDMQKAGLNPMLAYQQGGASTPTSSAPSGASASSPQGNAMQNPASSLQKGISDAVASAQQQDMVDAQVGKLSSDKELNGQLLKTAQSQAKSYEASAKQSAANAKLTESTTPYQAAKAAMDLKFVGADRALGMSGQAIDAAKSAKDVIFSNPFGSAGKIKQGWKQINPKVLGTFNKKTGEINE